MKLDWNEVYRNVAHVYDRDNELLSVSRESLRLALAALTKSNSEEAYHNLMAAEYEIRKVLND